MSFKKLILSSLVLGSCLLLPSCGGDVHDNSKLDLIGGTESSPGLFPGVVYLGNGCTASKIGPRSFLTASHCIVDRSSNVIRADYSPGSVLQVTKSTKLDATAIWTNLPIEKSIAHPSYRVADTSCGNNCNALGQKSFDIALVRVTQDSPDIPVVAFTYDFVADNSDVYIMGYGCEIAVGGAAPTPQRLKFQLLSTLPKSALDGSPHVGSNDEIYRHNFLTPGDSYTTKLNASICPGDSGGPVIRYINGTFQVLGVNAYYSFPNNSGVSYTNWHTRLSDPYVAWWMNGNRSSYSCSILGARVAAWANAGKKFKFDLATSKIRTGKVQHSSYGFAENLSGLQSGNTVKLPIQVAFSDRNNFDRSKMDSQELWVDSNGSMQLKLVTWSGTMLPITNLVCEENGQVSGIVREGNGTSHLAGSFSW